MPLLAQRKRSARAVAPVFAVADKGGGEAEITLYGDVVESDPVNFLTGEKAPGLYISAESFNAELEKIKGASHVTVRLNSGGGDLYTGIAIYNSLKALGAKVTVHIDGLAASAASIIACAGDEVVATPASVFMVHTGYLGLFGFYSASDLDLMVEQMRAGTRAMENVYVAKTGKPAEEVAAMVAAETWMTGREIVDAGFADALEDSVDETAPEADGDGELIVAGVAHDVTAYRNVPDFQARAKSEPAAAAPAAEADKEVPPMAADRKGETHMNVTELREQHPDLVAEIESAAAAAERDRLAAIDEIADGIAPEMVASAKYEKPCTAQELAFASIKAQRDAAAQAAAADRRAAAEYMAATEEDDRESGAEGVGSEPTDPGTDDEQEKQDEEQAKADINAMASLLGLKKKGGR